MIDRANWESLKVAVEKPVLLTTEELADTPLTRPPTFLLASAKRTPERVELSVFRADLSDSPDLINVDTYEVWEELPPRIDVIGTIDAASTSANANLQRYLGGHVFLVKEKPGQGHHLPALPEEVLVLLKQLANAV